MAIYRDRLSTKKLLYTAQKVVFKMSLFVKVGVTSVMVLLQLLKIMCTNISD